MMDTKSIKISDERPIIWKKSQPKINDEGIWMPLNDYVPDGTETNYKLIISKEIFMEAYNKWIKENIDE